MRLRLLAIAVAGFITCNDSPASAQYRHLVGAGTIALKSGESIELGNVYWVSHCRSLLKSTPEVEVLEGPPQVTVSVKEAMVLPRAQSCAKKVPGGIIVITAKDIDDPSYTHLSVRVNYKTKDGDRKFGHVYNLHLVP
jgi:hypothetical protein